MRLDKFLKVSRIIKRRPLAKQIAGEGRISVNGTPAKASATLAEGDLLDIRFAQKKLNIKVLRFKEYIEKETTTDIYEVVQEEKINVEESFYTSSFCYKIRKKE